MQKLCAEALCGPASKQPDTRINASNYEKYVAQDAVKKFEAVIPKIMNAGNLKIADAKMLAAELKKKLKNGNKVDFEEWDSYQFNEIAEKLFQDNYGVIIDSSKPLAERLELKPDYPEDATDSFKKALDQYLASLEITLRNNPSDGILAGLYTEEEAALIAKEKMQQFIQKYEAIKKSKSEKLSDYKEEIDDFLESTDLSAENDIYDYSIFLSNVSFFNSALSAIETETWPVNPYPKCAEECKTSIKKLISNQDLITDLKQFESVIDYMGDPYFNVTSCRADVYSKAVGGYESGKVAKEVPQILENMLKHPLKKFSAESKKAYRSFVLGEIDVKSGSDNSYDNKINELKELLNSSVDDSSKLTNEYEEKSAGELVFEYYSNYKAGVDRFDGVEVELPCDSNGEVNMIWDSFSPVNPHSELSRSKISVSMFSDLHLATGKAVTAHELGHALSYFAGKNNLSEASNKDYMQTRSCISKLHQYKTPNSSDSYQQGTESIYVEEDTADSISYMAYNDGQLHECSLLSRNESKYIYLAMKGADTGSSHSESLLRLVREAFYKDVELPLSCNELVDQNKDNFRFEKCY